MRSFKSPLRWISRMLGVMVIGLSGTWAQAQSAGSRAQEAKRTWWLPDNVFADASAIDQLFYGILWLTMVICAGVFIAMTIFLVKYRYRSGRHARFIHGNNRLEAAWTLIPTVILALIAAVSQTSWARMKKPATPTPQQVLSGEIIEMRVVGIQFKWYFQYPGKDGKLGPLNRTIQKAGADLGETIGLDRSHPDAKDDVVSPVMYVPVDKPVYIHLTSVDVLHSFFLPEFRIKQDAVPGLVPKVWLDAGKTSTAINGVDARGNPIPFDIVCAELCGQGHYTMRGELYAVTAEQYAKWLKTEYEYLGLDDAESGDAGY